MSGNCCERASHALVDKISYGMGAWGAYVARYPQWFKLFVFVLFGATAAGAMNFEFEQDNQVLYPPKNSPEKNAYLRFRSVDEETNERIYRGEGEGTPWRLDEWGVNLKLTLHKNGENVWTNAAFEALKDLGAALEDQYPWFGTSEGISARLSALDISTWYQQQYGAASTDYGSHTITAEDPPVEVYWPMQTTRTEGDAMKYRQMNTAHTVGVVNADAGLTTPITSAEALFVGYLWTDADPVDVCEWVDEVYKAGTIPSLQPYSLAYYSADSVGEELLKATMQDAPKLGIAMGALGIFIFAFMYRHNKTKMLALTGLAGMGCGLMGVASGLGFAFWIGTPAAFNTMSIFMPFLVISIGVDDMFVLARSFELTPAHLTPAERIRMMMYEGGVSITVTSLTDIIAFASGYIMVPMPGVADLCLFCCYGIIFVYIYVITLLLTIITCQAHREAAGVSNMCACRFCCRSSRSTETGATEKLEKQESIVRVATEIHNKAHASIDTRVPKSYLNFMENNVDKAWWRIVLFIICGGLLAFWIVGIVKVLDKIGLDYANLAPSDSYLTEWYAVRDRYLDKTDGIQAHFVFDDETCDYNNTDVINGMKEAWTAAGELNCILLDQSQSWIQYVDDCLATDCVTACDSSTSDWATCATWFINVGRFGDYPGMRLFFDQLYRGGYNNPPKASQFLLKLKSAELVSFDREVCLQGLVNIADSAPCNAFVYNEWFTYWAGDATVVKGLYQTLLVAFAACFLISLVFLPSLIVIFIILISIAFIMTAVTGMVYWFGFRLDALTQTMIVMSLGFAVDFCVHLAHSYLTQEGTRKNRAIRAVASMGEAIVLSALSTVLGIAVLFTSSPIIVIFASMTTCVMIIGMLVSLFVLPTLLAAFGPDTISETLDADTGVEMGQTTNGTADKQVDF